MRDLARLLRPRSIAVLGGGWARNVVAQLRRSGYAGAIHPVSPTRAEIGGIPCLPDLDALPAPPDAVFVGVNRDATVDVVARLAAMGAGGAVCFASGFRETEAEGTGGTALEARLVAAAGAMPILGPNCYGFLNYLDGVTLWPDQHGGVPVARGVALVSQSSNVAINLTMQRRGLPLAYVLTAGNQAQTGLADLAGAALADPRVTAVGLYVEGFGDLCAFEAMAAAARAARKPVVVLKAGRSISSRAATLTHTASLAGTATTASAFLERLGITEVSSPAILLETLKLLHFGGPLPGPGVLSVSCSGGEASLIADIAEGGSIAFPPIPIASRRALSAVLGPLVTVANPLDYHTFIWGDAPRTTACFSAALGAGADLGVFVLDLPRADRCDPQPYEAAVTAIVAARAATGARAAVISTIPETLDETAVARFIDGGVTPLLGMADGLAAIDAAIRAGALAARPEAPPAAVLAASDGPARTLSEAEAKAALAGFGLDVPRATSAPDAAALAVAAADLRYPLALKGLGIAHKTEAGAVVLGLAGPEALAEAAGAIQARAEGLLAEEMVAEPVAELIVGVTRDETGLAALTLGAGGIHTELLRDTATLILPASRVEIAASLADLRIGAVLAGYRGRPAADIDALVDAVEAIAAFALSQAGRLVEIEVNPLIATPNAAIAVDALIRLTEGDRP